MGRIYDWVRFRLMLLHIRSRTAVRLLIFGGFVGAALFSVWSLLFQLLATPNYSRPRQVARYPIPMPVEVLPDLVGTGYLSINAAAWTFLSLLFFYLAWRTA